MKQALSALVVHDLKNALALLEADLERLNHYADIPPEGRMAYRRCIELKGRLVGFLTLYKQEHGGLKAHPAEVALADFLEDLIASSQSVEMAGKHGREVVVRFAAERVRIAPETARGGSASLDERLLDLALESALNNAVRYAASRVELWFEQEAGKVTFYVLDDGPGLSHPEDLMHGELHDGAHTGLGIALCRAVAEAHGGGEVSLADAPARGAMFRLAVPAT